MRLKVCRSDSVKRIWEIPAEEYLFDLKRDVGESHDLLEKRPREVRRLKALLADWEEEVRHDR